MNEVPSNGPLSPWGALRKDPIFWGAVVLVGVGLVPYFIPILSEDQFWWWRWSYFDIPLSLAAVVAVTFGIGRLEAGPERRFWRFILLGYAATAAVQIAQSFLPQESWTTVVRLGGEGGYLLYYLAMFLAADASRGDVEDPRSRRIQRLQTVGLGIVLMGFVAYAQAVRTAVGPWWNGDGMLVLVFFDAAVCALFFVTARLHQNERWRRILRGMTVVAVAWLLVDGAEEVLYLEPFASMEIHPLWDLIWIAPNVALILVARRHIVTPEEVSVAPGREEGPDMSQGLMVAGLLSLPMFHALAYGASLLDPALREARDFVVYAFLAVMGVATLAYLRALEQERSYSRDQLEANVIERQATLERLREFLGDASHEIRTPISVLLTDVDVSLLEKRSPPEYEAVLSRVRGELLGVVDRTQDLLTLAGESVGVLDLDYSDIDLQALVDGVVETYAGAASLRRIEIATDVTPGVTVPGDIRLVGDAISNLVDNAVKFAPTESRIVVSVAPEEELVAIEVEDAGPGLDPSDAPRIFDRFYRGHSTEGGPPGSGLGLAIVKSVADRHHGTVAVRANQRGGTTFILRLPAIAPVAAHQGSEG